MENEMLTSLSSKNSQYYIHDRYLSKYNYELILEKHCEQSYYLVDVWSDHQLYFVSVQSQQYDSIFLEECVFITTQKFKVELSVKPNINLPG